MLKPALAIVAVLLLAACSTASDRRFDANQRKASVFNAELGSGYLARGNLEQAKVKFEKALEQNPENPKANSGYALLQARLGKKDEAEKYFRRAIDLDGEDSEVLNNYGAYLCQQNRHVEAETLFLEAAGNPLYKTPEYAYRNAGTCALSAGDPERAKAYFERALDANPRFGDALLDMASLSREEQQFQSALAYLERYHRMFPQSPQSLLLAVGVYRDLGDRRRVSDFAARLTNLFPQSAEARLVREQGIQ